MLNVYFTRHGQSIHNLPENEWVWQHLNEDVLGLTPEGIKCTIQKAKALTEILDHNRPIVIFHTGAIRAIQTASLLHSELLRLKFSTEPFCHLSSTPLTRFKEITSFDKLSESYLQFSYDEFKKDSAYPLHGRNETFATRCETYAHRLSEGDMQNYVQIATQDFTSLALSPQVVIVSHHYAINAVLAAGCMTYAGGSKNPFRKIIDSFLGHALPHEKVLDLTSCFYRLNQEAHKADPRRAKTEWQGYLDLTKLFRQVCGITYDQPRNSI
jgi:broad specificity phosphatase PhoE